MLPTALSGALADRKMTASEGGVMSIGSESELTFRLEAVLPMVLSGARGAGR